MEASDFNANCYTEKWDQGTHKTPDALKEAEWSKNK